MCRNKRLIGFFTLIVLIGCSGSVAWAQQPVKTGLVFWLDASKTSSLTLSGDKVSRWNDLSGNNNYADQTAAAQQPTYRRGALSGKAIVKVNQWNHVAVTISPTEVAVWLNGYKEVSRPLTVVPTVILGDGLIGAWLGTDNVTISRNFTGKIDDARFYNRTLSQEEIGSLAGWTAPFPKPY